MKKALGEIFSIFLAILVVILLAICFIFMLPLDYIRYKRSLYYKKEHKKYQLFAGNGINFELYNEILKNDFPIKYISNPNAESLECGWFVLNNTLIIPSVVSFEFDSENGKWNYCNEDDEENEIIMSLDEYIETEIQEANELAGQIICNDAIILIDSDCIENVDMAKTEKRFLVYDDNREEILKQLCKS